MNQLAYDENYTGNAADNYHRFFVPSIGRPVADDLIAAAGIQPGQRVLDVACGTGVVTRMAADAGGTTTGLDINPEMLAVAQAETPAGVSIAWYQADAEKMPLPDNAFDVVLCQFGLQFIPNKLAALREMHRVVAPGGRTYITVPGPKPDLFAIMTDALARHLSGGGHSFVDLVFSMSDADELTDLLTNAGFRDVKAGSKPKALRVPAPAEFLWQYLYSTPVAEKLAHLDAERRAALERDVSEKWSAFVDDDGFTLFQVGVTTAIGVG